MGVWWGREPSNREDEDKIGFYESRKEESTRKGDIRGGFLWGVVLRGSRKREIPPLRGPQVSDGVETAGDVHIPSNPHPGKGEGEVGRLRGASLVDDRHPS